MLTVVLCAVALGQLVLGDSPQVTTSQGAMKGQVLKSRDGRDYFSFTKIPYAKPPLGERRFVISEKADNWTGIFDATQHIPSCYQPDMSGSSSATVGQEDCLYLNIFTPNLTGRYPVIFGIHGGAYITGSADSFESANYFMDEDVVFVTPQYRLGTLGFLSLGDHVIPGNMGLKDQALALEWVQKEISGFGGDPNRITVIGGSAGGVSSDIICSVPRTNGIIKACVSQSGVALSPLAIIKSETARQMALKLAKAVGCAENGDILTCLQSKPVEQVGNVSLMIDSNDPTKFVTPVLESVGVPTALLTRWPTATNHNYPWIIGVCQDDGLVVTQSYESHMRTQKEIDNFVSAFDQTLISRYHLENRKHDLKRIRERYFKNGVEPIRAIRNYYTEFMFAYPALKSSSDHPGATYFYKFNYSRGPEKKSFNGVPHASEMPYFFETKSSNPDWPNAEDTALSKKLVTMWTNFAKDHNPSIQGKIEWPQFKGQYYLDIQDSGISISNWTDYQETLDFWKSIEEVHSKSTTSQSFVFLVVALFIFSVVKIIFL